MNPRSLQGCRVLDLGIITAGAATSALLADLGAQVVKIESDDYRDPFRIWAPSATAATPTSSPYFRSTNRNKRGAAINLKQPDGRAAFLRLVAHYDVVVENFRRGVLERLGLSFADLRRANPKIILASISSQGEDGPHSGHVSFGSTLDAMGGLAWLSGYAGGPPVLSGQDLNYPDQVVALFAVGMIATAWHQKSAEGAHLDISQRELVSFLCGESFLTPNSTTRISNADPDFALQSCFLAADGIWLAVSVPVAQVSSLRGLLVLELGLDPGFDLGAGLGQWVKQVPAEQSAIALRDHGIPAACANDGAAAMAEQGVSWLWAMQQASDGVPIKGFPFQLAAMPLAIDCDAPEFGADTVAVLREAGYSTREIDRLLASLPD
jgi:formyl-CoA transferase